MAYIGRTPQVGNYQKLDDISASFNGSSTAFSMAVAGAAFTATNASQLIVSIAGVLQEPETGYTVSGSTLTFTGPPASGADFFAIALGQTLDIGIPSDNGVTAGKIATGGVSANTQLAAGVVTAHAVATDIAKTDSLQTYTQAQRGTVTNHGTLIANTAFRQDFAASNHFKMTLGGNITINNPTNQVAGQSGAIEIVNGGSYTVSFGADFDFAGGTAPTITSSGTDVLSYYVSSANNIVVDAIQNLS